MLVIGFSAFCLGGPLGCFSEQGREVGKAIELGTDWAVVCGCCHANVNYSTLDVDANKGWMRRSGGVRVSM